MRFDRSWFHSFFGILCILRYVCFLNADDLEIKKWLVFEVTSNLSGCQVQRSELESETLGNINWNMSIQFEDFNSSASNTNENSSSNTGLLMLVMNPVTLNTTFTKVFRTHELFGFYLDLRWHLTRLQTGSVVALVVSAAGTAGLRGAADDLRDAGALMAHHLPAGAHWVWIFVKGGRTLLETAVLDTQGPVLANMFIPVADARDVTKIMETDRYEICQTMNILDDLCSVTWFPFPRLVLNNSDFLDSIPIVMTVGTRPQYMYAALKAMHLSPGFRPENLHVLCGGQTADTLKLLDFFKLNYTVIEIEGTGNPMLFQYYRKVFKFIAENFQSADAVMIIDEDVEVSPDFFSYMSQVMPVMMRDPTLYCATATSFFPSPRLYLSRNRVRRGESQVGWGYAIKMSVVRQALERWPTTLDSYAMYDHWIYEEVVESGECIFPEVSRAKHFGVGINAVGIHMETNFLQVQMETQSGMEIYSLEDIPLLRWRQELQVKLENSEIISGDPCSENFFTDREDGSYIFAYHLEANADGSYDMISYFISGLCSCELTYSGIDYGSHDHVVMARVKPGVEIYFLGAPLSSFSYVLGSNTAVWNYKALDDLGKVKALEKAAEFQLSVKSEVKSKYNKKRFMHEVFSDGFDYM